VRDEEGITMARESDGAAKARARAKAPLKKILDQRLIDALSHPVRGHVLAVLNERVASPAEVAREIGVDVNYIYYHFDQLGKNGLIELVRTEPKRGAREHFYKVKTICFVDDEEWAQLPTSLKTDLSADLFRAIADKVGAALRGGTLDVRDETHMSWMTKHVDAKGFSDLAALLEETLRRALAIADESSERLAKTGDESIPTTVAMLGFEAAADPVAPGAKAAVMA
jgi:predicted ArsR family transcriptional regulator